MKELITEISLQKDEIDVFYSNIDNLSEKIQKISKDEKLRKLIAKKGQEKIS